MLTNTTKNCLKEIQKYMILHQWLWGVLQWGPWHTWWDLVQQPWRIVCSSTTSRHVYCSTKSQQIICGLTHLIFVSVFKHIYHQSRKHRFHLTHSKKIGAAFNKGKNLSSHFFVHPTLCWRLLNKIVGFWSNPNLLDRHISREYGFVMKAFLFVHYYRNFSSAERLLLGGVGSDCQISNRIFRPKVETSQFVFTALKSYFPSPGIVLMKCESYDEVFTSNKARR